MFKRKTVTYILSLFIFVTSYSQSGFSFSRKIQWRSEQVSLTEAGPVFPLITSDDVRLNKDLVPELVIQQEVAQKGEFSLKIKKITTRVIDATRLAPSIISKLDTGFTSSVRFYTQNKKPVATITFNGLRLNALQQVEAISSIEGELVIVPQLNKTIGSTVFLANSILHQDCIFGNIIIPESSVCSW